MIGLEISGLSEAVSRLADFAQRAYGRDGRRRMRTLLYPTDPTLQKTLLETYQASGM